MNLLIYPRLFWFLSFFSPIPYFNLLISRHHTPEFQALAVIFKKPNLGGYSVTCCLHINNIFILSWSKSSTSAFNNLSFRVETLRNDEQSSEDFLFLLVANHYN